MHQAQNLLINNRLALFSVHVAQCALDRILSRGPGCRVEFFGLCETQAIDGTMVDPKPAPDERLEP